MAVRVGELYGLLRMDDSQFNTSMLRAEQRTAGFGSKLAGLGKFAAIGGLAIGSAFAGLITKTFIDFDDKLNQSLAIMGDVSDEMRGEMSDAAREVAKTTVFSASQAAESLFFLASAGLDAADSIGALPVVARFAQAGMFDMATATELLLDAQTALGLRVTDTAQNMENLTRVSDVLTQANIKSNASVQQFAEALTNRAAAAARLLGKDVEETVAVLEAMAAQGVKGEEAGERLSIVWRDLQTAAVKNAGTFKQFGIAVFDAQGNIRNTADILGDLETALGGASDEQTRMMLTMLGFQDRSVQAIVGLLGMSDAIRTYEADLRGAKGATQEIADKQMRSLNAQLILAWHGVQDLAISFGQALTPALRSAITGLRGAITAARPAVEALGALMTIVQRSGRVIAVFGAVTLGALFIPRMAAAAASTAALTAEMIRSTVRIVQMQAALRGVTVAQVLFNSAMATVASGGLAAIAIAIGAAATGLFVLYQRFLKSSDGADRLREMMERLDHAVDRGTRQFERQGFSLPDAELRSTAREYMYLQRQIEGANQRYDDAIGTLHAAFDAMHKLNQEMPLSGDEFRRLQRNAGDARRDVETFTKAQEELEKALKEQIEGRTLQETAQLLADLGLEAADIRDIAPEVAEGIELAGNSAAEAAENLTPAVERLGELFSVAEDAAGAIDGLRRSFDSLLAPETREEAQLRAQVSLYDAAIAKVKADASARGDSQEAIEAQTKAYEDAKKPLEAQLDLIGATKTATVDLAVAQNSDLLPSLDALLAHSGAYRDNLEEADVWNRLVADSIAVLDDAAQKAADQGLKSFANFIRQHDIPALDLLRRAAGADSPEALAEFIKWQEAARDRGLRPFGDEITQRTNPALSGLNRLMRGTLAPTFDEFVKGQEAARDRGLRPTAEEVEQRTFPAFSNLNRLMRGEVMPTLDELSEKDVRIEVSDNLADVNDRLRESLRLGDLLGAQGIAFQLPVWWPSGPPSTPTPPPPVGTPPPSRAHGGPVMANMPYFVGELGEELFTPAVAGQITPLPVRGSDVERSQAGISNHFEFHISADSEPTERALRAWAKQVKDEINDALRLTSLRGSFVRGGVFS